MQIRTKLLSVVCALLSATVVRASEIEFPFPKGTALYHCKDGLSLSKITGAKNEEEYLRFLLENMVTPNRPDQPCTIEYTADGKVAVFTSITMKLMIKKQYRIDDESVDDGEKVEIVYVYGNPIEPAAGEGRVMVLSQVYRNGEGQGWVDPVSIRLLNFLASKKK